MDYPSTEAKDGSVVSGYKVWRDLDWMMDEEKKMLGVDRSPNLASALVEVFDS